MNARRRNASPAAGSTLQTIVVAVAIVLVAGVVVDLLLWPRGNLPPIEHAQVGDFFAPSFVARATAFRAPQSALALVAALLLVLVPVAVAWCLSRVHRASVVGGVHHAALVGAGVAAVTLVTALPLEVWMFVRARRAGLLVQGFGDWLGDWLLSALLAAFVLALLALLCAWLIGRSARAWWALLAVVLVALAVVLQALSPLVIEPLFADFTPLPPGHARSDVRAVAELSGVHAGEIYEVDSSRRTSTANAYVSGLGATKRVVIYDTLLRDFPARERRAVIAHEFGHAKESDLWIGLLWFALVAPAALYAVSRASRALASHGGVEPASPAGVALVIAACACAVMISQPAANAFSRAVELRADAFALNVTRDPAAAIALERRLTIQNLGRPEPPMLLQFLLGTHPTPMQRIGMALGYADQASPGSSSPGSSPSYSGRLRMPSLVVHLE